MGWGETASGRKPRLLHTGVPLLAPGVIWKDERGGWRFDCPARCGKEPADGYGSPAAAAGAFREHWAGEKEAEVAALAQWRVAGAELPEANGRDG